MAHKKKRFFVVDEDKIRDESVSPWDVFTRPEKPLSAFTAHETGLMGERLAQVYLARAGYELLETNWRCPCGEVDLVAWEGGEEAVLVEVKTSLDLGAGTDVVPELRVDRRKRRRYRQLALWYLSDHPEMRTVRFDVIALTLVGERLARLRHLVCAYGLDEL